MKTGFTRLSRMNKLLCMYCLFAVTAGIAGEGEWKREVLEKGRCAVEYRISHQIVENGQAVPLIEYSASMTDTLSLASCVRLLKDIPRHKLFTGDSKSEKIKALSDTSWIVYYYSKNPWPIADNDCVAKMIYSEDKIHQTARFDFIAAPNEVKFGKVSRITCYDQTFLFKAQKEGCVEITVTSRVSPASKVPEWLIKASLPGAAVDCLKKIVELARKDG